MCGIVAGISKEDITTKILTGLNYLEYRGYDSAGIAFVNDTKQLVTYKALGKVKDLAAIVSSEGSNNIAIAHTRWATHGRPSKNNAHPHLSNKRIAIVHNGIIENFQEIKAELIAAGYQYLSETDSEVIAHLIHSYLERGDNILTALDHLKNKLKGSYAIAVIDKDLSENIYAIVNDSPLVIGLAKNANYLASDQIALLEVSSKFIYLNNNNIAVISTNNVTVYDENNKIITTKIHNTDIKTAQPILDGHKHYMHKEIHEQPHIAQKILDHYQSCNSDYKSAKLQHVLQQCDAIHIIGCGSSYNAAYLAKYWFEEIANTTTVAAIASEYRYQHTPSNANTLCIFISQSGETADTLAALRLVKKRQNLATISLCNSPYSSLARETDIFLNIFAEKEIGVASTKAFTAQIISLLLLVLEKSKIAKDSLLPQLLKLPQQLQQALALEDNIISLATKLVNCRNILFLGRNTHYPVAMEAALKLKEISYIHANSYAAGELKHGPLALVDKDLYLIYLLPNNFLLDKNYSNIAEIQARGGKVICISESCVTKVTPDAQLVIPESSDIVSAIIYNIPLQLLAYYVALQKGNNVDQPRNLAKSVTVE